MDSLRGNEYTLFNNNLVSLSPNPNFLAKSEYPIVRRDPTVIQRLMRKGDAPHPLPYGVPSTVPLRNK